jgi:hypothetical protein
LLNTTPGRAIEYEFVAHWLFGFVGSHNVAKIAFDRWGWKHLRPWLLRAGFTEEQVGGDADKPDGLFVGFGQGFQSMSPALRDLESALLSQQGPARQPSRAGDVRRQCRGHDGPGRRQEIEQSESGGKDRRDDRTCPGFRRCPRRGRGRAQLPVGRSRFQPGGRVMGWREFIGYPTFPEQRMITEIPGIERPGSNILQVFGQQRNAADCHHRERANRSGGVVGGGVPVPHPGGPAAAHLPQHRGGPEKIAGGLQTLIHEAPNPEWTSFKLRQYFWQQVFTGGRGLLWIERSGSNIVGLWPIIPDQGQDQARRPRPNHLRGGSTVYFPRPTSSTCRSCSRPMGMAHYGPIVQGAKAIQLALAMNDYGSTFFAGGGVPPLAVNRPPSGRSRAMKRARLTSSGRLTAPERDSKPIVDPAGLRPEAHRL